MSRSAGSEDGCIRIVGTAHVSEKSVREVEETIDAERPDVVAVELDENRYRQLKGETPEDLDPSDLLQGNTVFQFLAYWMLSYVQTRLGEKFDVEPGADMLAAVERAEGFGIDVALVDRDIQTTMQRFWKRMSFVEKFRMIGALAFGVTDPRVAGVTFGAFVGIVLGPLIGLFGGSVGITQAVLTRMAAGGIAGVAVGYAVARFGAATMHGLDRLFAAIGAAMIVGFLVAAFGLGAELIASVLGEFMLRAIGSLALGLAFGIVLGVVVAGIIGAFGVGIRDDVDELDELDVDELTDTDAVSAMLQQFREFSPGGAEALIDERDAYIAHQLLALRGAGHDVVAVVGAGHRQGIESYLERPETLPPMESLVGQASSRGIPWGKIVGFLLGIGFVAFFVLLAMAGVRSEFLLQLFAAWFLINAVFAFTLAKLAGARWSSATVGGAVAWMTSINPLLAPGWFAGYVELRHTAVNVTDIGRLNDLLADETKPIDQLVSEMFDVPLFRLIMIVAATNFGSIIASILFVTYVLPLFAADLGGVDAIGRLMLDGARESARQLWGIVA